MTIDELMARNMVTFEYTKLAFVIGGEATNVQPSKVYLALRVSCSTEIFLKFWFFGKKINLKSWFLRMHTLDLVSSGQSAGLHG